MATDRIELGGLIARLQRFHRRFITPKLEQIGLSGEMHAILSTLSQNPGVSQDFLAVRFNMDKGIIARQCKALEEHNLIRREVNANDRRQYCLYLTDEGKSYLPNIRECYFGWNNLICKDFTQEELEQAQNLLARMVENCIEDIGKET